MRWQPNIQWAFLSHLDDETLRVNAEGDALVCDLKGLGTYAACQSHAFMKASGTFILGEQRLIPSLGERDFLFHFDCVILSCLRCFVCVFSPFFL